MITTNPLRFCPSLWVAAAVASACTGAVFGQVLNLGTIPGGDASYALGVSGDGSTAIGYGWHPTLGGYAFRWTSASGMVDLGTLPGTTSSNAEGVSGDGSVVVGSSYVGYFRAYRWTGPGGMVNLGTLPSPVPALASSFARGVSGDGAVVVGESTSLAAGGAFRWTSAGGMENLGTLPGGLYSVAYGASGDGAVVVGAGTIPGSGYRAFRWTSAGGMENLGAFPGGVDSVAYGVSSDGSTVVGMSEITGRWGRAFRWTSAGGMVSLGTLPGGLASKANAVSGDGSAVVGWSYDAFGAIRAILATSLGMHDLNTYLHKVLGFDLTGWFLYEATGISADGMTIVGRGLFEGWERGWLVKLIKPSNRPPVPGTIGDRTVHAGSLVSLTATATDPDVPADLLTFTLDPGAPATAAINPTNGVFTWTPGSASIGSTNAITVRVTDDGAPVLSATTTFQITVVSPPIIQSITVSGDDLTLTWSAIAGSTYRVQYKPNLEDLTWTDLPGDVTATDESASKLDTIAGEAQRFYRIFFVP